MHRTLLVFLSFSPNVLIILSPTICVLLNLESGWEINAYNCYSTFIMLTGITAPHWYKGSVTQPRI